MGISCGEFLSSALTLLGGTNEVDYRNAASRGYYAAYHACIPVAKYLPDYADVSGGSHKRLIERLCASNNMKHKTLGYSLQQIKALRGLADYEINDDFPEKYAKTVITTADRIIKDAAQIPP
jgi:uncharacterized protein (UPF0332 family)